MKSLSHGADIAWRIAAHEAAASGYKFIEKEHLLIGIVSIEKVIADGPEHAGIKQNDWQEACTTARLMTGKLYARGWVGGTTGISKRRMALLTTAK